MLQYIRPAETEQVDWQFQRQVSDDATNIGQLLFKHALITVWQSLMN